MGVLSLFFPSIQTRAKIDQLDLDVSLTETHEASASLTQTEVEEGPNITDHVTLSPIKLTIEGVVSRTPLGSSALVGSLGVAAGGAALRSSALGRGVSSMPLLSGAAAAIGGSIGGLVSNAFGADALKGASSRSPKDVYDYLLELRNRRKPFEVVTALKKYDNMVVTSISVPRSSATTGVLRFTATFEQIRVVSATTIDLGSLSALGGKTAEAAKLGKQSATQAAQKTIDNSTVGFKIFKYFGG